MKKHIEGMVFIGWVLLAIAFLMDDISTLILMNYGFGVAETNPIYQALSVKWIFFVLGISLFLLMAWALSFAVNKYRRLFMNKLKGYKNYDFFLFFICLMVSFIVVVKITVGISNIALIGLYSTDEGKIKLDAALEKLQELKDNSPGAYSLHMQTHYHENVYDISFIQTIIIGMLAYFLYRIGIGVRPSDLG